MAAFTGTPAGSTQYNLLTGVTQGGTELLENFKLRPFSYTHALGAGTGEVNLVILPEGKTTVYSQWSFVATSAMAAGADLHLGFRAYTEPDGDLVVEDDNAFMDNGDAATGITHAAFPLPAAPGVTHFNYGKSTTGISRGLVIYGMIDTGNIEDTDTIAGWVAYASLR